MFVRLLHRLAAAVFLLIPTVNPSLAQKFPSCASDEVQTKMKEVARNWYLEIMQSANRQRPNYQPLELADFTISIPQIDRAFFGKYSGGVACTTTATAFLRRQGQVVRLPIPNIIVYFAYDQQGNLIAQIPGRSP